jgi:hypothetical protein
MCKEHHGALLGGSSSQSCSRVFWYYQSNLGLAKDSMVIQQTHFRLPSKQGLVVLWEAHLRDFGGVDHHVFVTFCHFATESFELGVASVLSQFP